MSWKDMQNYEDQRLAENRASAQGWLQPSDSINLGAGQMQPTTDPGEYGLLQYIADAVQQHNAYQNEMTGRAWGGQGGIDPEVVAWLSDTANMMGMGTVGPSKFSPAEATMRQGAKAGQLSRQSKMRWNDPDLNAGLDAWVESQKRGGTPSAPSWLEREASSAPTQPKIDPMKDIIRDYEFQGGFVPDAASQAIREKNIIQQRIKENPYIDAASLETRMKNRGGATHPKTSEPPNFDNVKDPSGSGAATDPHRWADDFDWSEYTPRMQNTLQRNLVLKAKGIDYQHKLPEPGGIRDTGIGYNPDAWYSPSSILDALGWGLKEGYNQFKAPLTNPNLRLPLEEPIHNAINTIPDYLPSLPQLPGRAKAWLSEYPFIPPVVAAGGAGYAFGPDMGQYTEGIAIPNTEASKEQARKFETGLAKHAGTAPPVLPKAPKSVMQRAQEPWWGVTPEDIKAAADYFAEMARNPFRRMAGL